MEEQRRELIRKKVEEKNKEAGIRLSRNHIELICQAIEEKEEFGKPLKESLGFTPQMLKAMYEFACKMGQGGEYEDAYSFYNLLCKIDSQEDVRYVRGKATAAFMLGNYEEAIDLFKFCYALEPKNLGHLWYAIEASSSLGTDVTTMPLLQLFLEEAKGNAEYSADYERGKLMVEAIELKRKTMVEQVMMAMKKNEER